MFNIRISQIFVHSADEAVAAKKELDAGQGFVGLVEKYSACPSKTSGGDLGWMNEDQALSFMGEKLTGNDKGKILGPIHSQYGYHILSITDVTEEKAPEVFSADTSMIELGEKIPGVNDLLFQKFQVGLPVMGYQSEDTIGSICNKQGKQLNDVLDFLNLEFSKSNVPTISPKDLKSKIDSAPDSLAILDIREDWERDIAKISAALLITRENCDSILNSLKKDMELVVVDWKSDRSPSFLKWLSQRGFTDAKGLEGGIDAWAETVDVSLARYDIDEDDGYRYEDVMEEPPE